MTIWPIIPALALIAAASVLPHPLLRAMQRAGSRAHCRLQEERP